MTGTRGKIAAAALAACVALTTAACSQSAQTRSCDRADAVRSSVEDLRNVNLSENGMVALESGLAQVRTELDNLRSDVRADLQPEVDSVRASAVALLTAVSGAKADPTSESLSKVGTGLAHLRSEIGDLRGAVGGGC